VGATTTAVVGFVLGEEGADAVDAELIASARCGAANWSEVAQGTTDRVHQIR
jgi:hypothetical protein